MQGATITDGEFERLRRFFHSASGIRLADSKKVLVCGRLSKRLRHHNLGSYAEYLSLMERPGHQSERQVAIDLLTTNETHFFREPRHFDILRDELQRLKEQGQRSGVRLWSAACSSGEEPYSLAMTLAEVLGDRPWSVLASDLSARVLADAELGIFGSQRASEVPRPLSRKYLLEGIDEYTGQYRVVGELRARVQFAQINLMQPLPAMEPFDAIFLRNVLIYFDNAAKRQIVESVVQALRPGGLLFIGHAESLNGITQVVAPVVPTVFRRPS